MSQSYSQETSDSLRNVARSIVSSRVMVVAAYEDKPRHRRLFWDGDKPYVLIGRHVARRREYLTSYTSHYNGQFVIFKSEYQGKQS